MACGIPSVATDVGDSAWLLARSESIAPPGDARALADRMRSLLAFDAGQTAAVAREARERIVTHFSVTSLVNNTERALSSLFVGAAV
jgi:glycosyltransferase involved in cell wall biosynthesis